MLYITKPLKSLSKLKNTLKIPVYIDKSENCLKRIYRKFLKYHRRKKDEMQSKLYIEPINKRI